MVCIYGCLINGYDDSQREWEGEIELHNYLGKKEREWGWKGQEREREIYILLLYV